MNRCAPPSFLTVDWISTLFPAATLKGSRQLYERHVVASADGALPDALLIGGTEALTRSVRSLIGATLFLAAVPRSTRGLARPPLFELFDGIRKRDRRRTILRAHVVHGYQLSEIARHLDLHPTTVSRIVNGTGTYQATIASE
jgi:DNA-binding NarL/FixJ family response regulator